MALKVENFWRTFSYLSQAGGLVSDPLFIIRAFDKFKIRKFIKISLIIFSLFVLYYFDKKYCSCAVLVDHWMDFF